VAGIQGPQGGRGPRGHRGPAGADGAAAPAPAAVPASGGSTSAGAVDEKQQACIDTFQGILSQAQVDQYCAPGGMYYGAGSPGN
jgi:hypothetical protein